MKQNLQSPPAPPPSIAPSVSAAPDLPLIADFFATPQRFLWHAPTRTAIVADLHLGIESSLASSGISMPDAHTAPLRGAWSALLARSPRQIVIGGDLFDSPSPPQAAISFARVLLQAIPSACRLIMTPGNHDPEAEALGLILADIPLTIQSEFPLGSALISHGHVLPPADGHSIWIVGHQHPAVTLATRVQRAKMPVFARCRSRSSESPREVILVPAFSRAPLGCNLLSARQWLLPIPRPANSEIRISGIVEGDEIAQVLDFGTLVVLESACQP